MRGLDQLDISLTGVGNVRDGGGRSGEVGGQRGPRNGLLDGPGDAFIRPVSFSRAEAADEVYRQVPSFVILARHHLAQGRCADEVLHHHDVTSVLMQLLD